MKKFKNFINEEVNIAPGVVSGKIDVHDNAVRDNINAFLNGVTAQCFITPYVGLEKVAKVLANFHIHLPKAPFLEGDHGVHVFDVGQFGRLAGQRNDGTIVTKVDSPFNLYFEWKMDDRGMFKIFSEIVSDDELEELLDDVQDDMEGDETSDGREDKFEDKMYEETDSLTEAKMAGAKLLAPKKKSLKQPELKTSNAKKLQAALAAAKTKLAQLSRQYKVPNETKQPSKSMPLSEPADAPTDREPDSKPLSHEKEHHVHHFGYMDEQESHSAMEVLPRAYKTRYTGTPEQQHMYQVVRQRELRKQTAKDYKPGKLVPNVATEPPKPKG